MTYTICLASLFLKNVVVVGEAGKTLGFSWTCTCCTVSVTSHAFGFENVVARKACLTFLKGSTYLTVALAGYASLIFKIFKISFTAISITLPILKKESLITFATPI